MKQIAPSILSADFARLEEEIGRVEEAGADIIHIDVMDGHFVPNITIGPAVVASIRRVTRLPFDVHLMIENPERYIDAFVGAGSDYITVHAEASSHLHRTLSLIREAGVKAGLSLNPATSLSCVEEVIGDLDLLLVMTVNPGFGGQQFITTVLPKVERARALIDARAPDVLLEVDGGITPDNIADVSEAGADIFVAGSSIFQSHDYRRTIAAMKGMLSTHEA